MIGNDPAISPLALRLLGPLLALNLLLTLGCVAAPHHTPPLPSLRAKGFAPATATAEALQDVTAPRSLALVVGINSYDDPTWPALRYPAEDAASLAAHLRSPEGGFDDVTLLGEAGHVSRGALLNTLSHIGETLDRRDTLLVYISSHGTLLPSPGAPTYYLVTSDTQGGDLPGTGIELSSLMAYLQTLTGEGKVVIFDSCFSGSGKSRIPEPPPGPSDQPLGLFGDFQRDLERAEALLMATGLGGSAQEDDRLGHGVFTHFLLQALGPEAGLADANGDGAVSAYEAHDHARQGVLDWTQGTQRPDAYFRLSGAGQVFLTGTPAEGSAKDARIYAYGGEQDEGYSLEVDGRSKGAFPRTIAVPGGRHYVRVKGAEGDVIAQGPILLGDGQIYPLPALIRDLQEPRWRIRVEAGAQGPMLGPASIALGTGGPQVGIAGGRYIRGGAMKGLTLGPRLALSPPRVGGSAQGRGLAAMGIEGSVRRRILPEERGEIGLTLGAGVLYTWGGAGAADGAATSLILAEQRYLLPEMHLGALGGVVLSEELRVLLRPEVGIMRGAPGQGTPLPLDAPLSIRGLLSLGVEYGF